jgi:hypothetical protein
MDFIWLQDDRSFTKKFIEGQALVEQFDLFNHWR